MNQPSIKTRAEPQASPCRRSASWWGRPAGVGAPVRAVRGPPRGAPAPLSGRGRGPRGPGGYAACRPQRNHREAPARDRQPPCRTAAPGRRRRRPVRGPRRLRHGLRRRRWRGSRQGDQRGRQALRRQDRGAGADGGHRRLLGAPVRHPGQRRQVLHPRHAPQVRRRHRRGEVPGGHIPGAARRGAALPEGQRGLLGRVRLGRQARRQVREGARERPHLQAVPRLHRHGRPARRAARPRRQAHQEPVQQGRAGPRGPAPGRRGQGRPPLGVPRRHPLPAAHGTRGRRRPGGARGLGPGLPAGSPAKDQTVDYGSQLPTTRNQGGVKPSPSGSAGQGSNPGG